MTQRNLLIGATAVTLALGAVFYVSSQPNIQADSDPVYVLNQANWSSSVGSNAVAIDLLKPASTSNLKKFWQDWLSGSVPPVSIVRMAAPDSYAAAERVRTTVASIGSAIGGRNNTKIDDGYIISPAFQLSNNRLADWQQLGIRYKAGRNNLKFYYRIAEAGTTDPKASDWQEVSGLTLNGQSRINKTTINQTGKVFQYKVNIRDDSSIVRGVVVTAQADATTSSPSPTISTTVTPSGSLTPTPSPTISPVTTPITQRTLSVWQRTWKQESNEKTVAINDTTKTKSIDAKCAAAEDRLTTYDLTTFAASANKGTLGAMPNGEQLLSVVNAKDIDKAYMISQAMTINTLTPNNTINWARMKISYERDLPGSIKLYYRVFDDPAEATESAVADDWIAVSDPATVGSKNTDKCKQGKQIASYRIDEVGKYFQYKVHVSRAKKGSQTQNQKVDRIMITADELSHISTDPTPTPSVTPTASASPTATGPGKITLVTRYVPKAEAIAPSPSPSGAALPNLTPSPAASPTTDPDLLHPGCETGDDAPNVPIKKIIQTSVGGPEAALAVIGFTSEEEITSEEGSWQGKNGEIDDFTVGTYQVTFGDYQKNDYKLVAFCVYPSNDGSYHIKTATDPATSKVTFYVKPGQETKVVALYAPRVLPFITMSKYAIDARTLEDAIGKTQRVMRFIYPGQQFLYRINYKNTGDTAAKNVLIQDVLPEQFELADEVLNDDVGKYGLTVDIDAQGRTLLKKQIGDLAAGAEGSIYIPVTLRATAFDAN